MESKEPIAGKPQDDEEAAWKQICVEMIWKISLADFRAFTPADLEDVLKDVPAIIRGKLRRMHLPPVPSKTPLFAPELLRIPDSDLTLDIELGRGTFSVVSRGIWTRTLGAGMRGVKPQTVAVKVPMSFDFVADLSRELVVLANFPHQNLLQLYGVCESNPPKLVLECMKTDLATALEEQKLRTRYQKVRVLKDVSSALAHLHAHGVIHRDVKPSNILLGDDQTKLCDLGSCKDMLQTVQHMTTVGTIAYMAPEMRLGRPVGRAADVWSFGVVLFEVLVGHRPDADPLMEMEQAGCLKVLRDMYSQCLSTHPMQRPTMAEIEGQLLTLLHQEVQDLENLRAELRTGLAQDLGTYNSIWETNYAQQSGMNELLAQVQQLDAKTRGAAARQPGSPTDYAALSLLADQVSLRMHIALQRVVESCNGRYVEAPRKSPSRVAQKVKEEYNGDFCRLVDFERATGLFKFVLDCHHCLAALCSGTQWELVRVKDRLTKGLDSGYRDVLLNISDRETGFVFELQLNFKKISEIKSQSHRFYELHRVTKGVEMSPAATVASSIPPDILVPLSQLEIEQVGLVEEVASSIPPDTHIPELIEQVGPVEEVASNQSVVPDTPVPPSPCLVDPSSLISPPSSPCFIDSMDSGSTTPLAITGTEVTRLDDVFAAQTTQAEQVDFVEAKQEEKTGLTEELVDELKKLTTPKEVDKSASKPHSATSYQFCFEEGQRIARAYSENRGDKKELLDFIGVANAEIERQIVSASKDRAGLSRQLAAAHGLKGNSYKNVSECQELLFVFQMIQQHQNRANPCHRAPINALELAYQEAYDSNTKYTAFFKHLCWDIKDPGIKSPFHHLQKMRFRADRHITNADCVKDILRRQVICNDDRELKTHLRKFCAESGVTIHEAKYRIGALGDVLLLFSIPGALVFCEVQFLLREYVETRAAAYLDYETQRFLHEIDELLKEKDRMRPPPSYKRWGLLAALGMLVLVLLVGKDWCSSTTNSCFNQGQCVNNWNGRLCLCAPGWTGTLCETETPHLFLRRNLDLLNGAATNLASTFETTQPADTDFSASIDTLLKTLDGMTFPNVQSDLYHEHAEKRQTLFKLASKSHVVMTKYRYELNTLGNRVKLIWTHLDVGETLSATIILKEGMSGFESTRIALQELSMEWDAFTSELEEFGKKLLDTKDSLDKDIAKDAKELSSRQTELLKYQQSMAAFFWNSQPLEATVERLNTNLEQMMNLVPFIHDAHGKLWPVKNLVDECKSFLDNVYSNMKPVKTQFYRISNIVYSSKEMPSSICIAVTVQLNALTELIQSETARLLTVAPIENESREERGETALLALG